MRWAVAAPYHGLMRSFLRSVLDEPRAPGAPHRVWRDWALVGIAMPAAVVEAALRPDLPWRWAVLAITLVLLPTLLYRRQHPLAVAAASFGAMLALSVADLVVDPAEPPDLFTQAVLVVTLYALVRWGSGREIALGGAIVLVTSTVAMVADGSTLGDAIGGYAVVGIIASAGAAVRFFDRARRRELEQVRSAEREQLARDLHDTVAHHVSAIAISAHAGLAVASTRPGAAVEALEVISAEASRTLNEMRAMVGVLRRDVPAELAPTPSLDDLHRLADHAAAVPVAVEVRAGVGEVDPSVATTLYRLAQESVTNARRHARRPSRVDVVVDGDAERVTLRVTDDGSPVEGARSPTGYGVLGMVERAGLLGGTCHAGPGPSGGWVVSAELPRQRVPV